MKSPTTIPTALALLAGLAIFGDPATAEVILSESFEAPVVTGFDDNTVPSSGWVGATNGFGATNRGLYNEFVAWPGTLGFSTPFGEQAYFLNYTNSALTTAQGATGENFVQDEVYTVTFNAAVLAGVATGSYFVEFLAFEPTDDDASRTDGQAGRPGTVVATASGAVTTNDLSEEGSLSFTPLAGDPNIGKEVGIRLVKGTDSVLYDNVRLIRGHDFDPTPASGVTVAAGTVALSWTNMTPNVGPNVFVDVWFGTDPVSDFTKVVDGGTDTATTNVSAPAAETYYWRVDSYLEGVATGTPVEGDLFVFIIADSDGDGFSDAYELANTSPPSNTGLNPGDDLENGGAGDGLTNLQEFQFGTDPNDPDSDGDNLEDGPEISGAGLRPATSPLDPDSDGDGLQDDVETNTGTWVGATDTGTNPIDPDWDDDGLPDGVETKTGIMVGRTTDTGTDPYLVDSDSDGTTDWYEVAGTLTDPNSDTESSPIPYPLPDPDPADKGTPSVPVKVYIMGGQSNTVGIGRVNGTGPGTLTTSVKTQGKFANLVDGSNEWLPRNDVIYKGVVSATAAGPLEPGQGASSDQLGPELGFGQVMGWYHDEPVLIIKASEGNRSLAWDFCPPSSANWDFAGQTYAKYGESPQSWDVGTTPTPDPVWYAGKQYDDCFRDEADWAPAGSTFDPIINAADILAGAGGTLQGLPGGADTLNGRTYEIAGFVWWQGHKDQDGSANPYAAQYETNLVTLIQDLRADFNAPNAPVVVATIGFEGEPLSSKEPDFQQVYNAQMAVGNPALHPEFAGTVKSVDVLPYWRSIEESPKNQNFHYNQNGETYMLVGDAMGRAMLTLQNDVSPPAPNPMTFAIAPTAVNTTTVGMVATTGSDPSGPVEYYFENISTVTNSGWITSTSWNSTGLTDGVSYNFRVKAKDALGNEGDWSATESAAPGTDGTAPSPDPMSFDVLPTTLGENSISMTAATATDINGVEYEFVSTVGGGPGSGWQASPEFTALGLSPSTLYSYVVRARDSIGNITADSGAESATTTGPDVIDPTVGSFSPLHESINVAVDTNLVVTFDEDIAVGTGNITLRNLTDGAGGDIVIDVTDGGQVTVSGAVLTIDPTGGLLEDKTYAVRIDVTAIDDLIGNSYDGISDDVTWFFSTPTPPPAGLLFSDSFEDPPNDTVSGLVTNKVPVGWVGSGEGFNSNRRGLANQDATTFSTPFGEQAAYVWFFNNAGLTTEEGAIGTLTQDVTYTVSFNVANLSDDVDGDSYKLQLVAFDPGEARNDVRSDAFGTVLGVATGEATTSDMSQAVSFDFTAMAGDPSLGKDLAIRIHSQESNEVLFDNVTVSSTGGGGGGNDFADWITGFPGVGVLTGFDDDGDGDGTGNGLENYFGTNPSEQSGGLVAGVVSGNTFAFTHPLNPSPADDVVAAYEWSTDLDTFYADGAGDGSTTVSFSQGTVVGDVVTVTATISGPVPDRLFVSIYATQSP